MLEMWKNLSPIFSSIVSVIAVVVSLYTFKKQITEQRNKNRTDLITYQETRYINDFIDNIVAFLVGTQRVLITFSDIDDDILIRDHIHSAEIYHFKLKIFLNREEDRKILFIPMNELHRMMMKRKDEKWKPNDIEKYKIE